MILILWPTAYCAHEKELEERKYLIHKYSHNHTIMRKHSERGTDETADKGLLPKLLPILFPTKLLRGRRERAQDLAQIR